MSESTTHASAIELARRIRARTLGAEELTRAYLERIEALDPALQTFIERDAEGALASARSVDRRLARGEEVGCLAGVPLALKDNLVTAGLPTSAGSRILAGWRPPYDGTAVARLRASDAVLLGKLNMDEFAMGSSCESSAHAVCHNPWDLERVPGGSSGGAAAAVAAGLCAGALGTDTGGSIRQPASFCGVTGLKPTYGRVSRYGVIAFASSLDQVGPLARTALDCAALLEVIGGPDPRDSTSIADPLAPGSLLQICSERRDLQGLRVGIPREYFGEGGLEPDVERAVREAIETLASLGAELREISLPHTRYAVAAYYVIATAEASSNLARYDGVRYGLRAPSQSLARMYGLTRQQGFGPEVKRRIMLGTFALSAGYYDAYYGRAQRVRTLIRRDFERAFAEQCDLIATPTSPFAAFRLGERLADPLQMYLADIFTISCNLAGLPGLSLPCGFTAQQLPVGLQLMAPPLSEAALLSVAAVYQRSTSWHLRHPPVAEVPS